MYASKKNAYPLDPRKELNPLRHLKTGNWYRGVLDIKNANDFNKYWEIKDLLSNNVYCIKEKGRNHHYLIKIYKTYNNIKEWEQIYKEFVFVRQTCLIEYGDIYYMKKTKEVYILMPYYGPSLQHIIQKNGPFKHENKIKLIAAELLDKIWIIHNAKYVHCDIKAANVVKREFNEEKKENEQDNKCIINGYKIIDFGSIHKNNSKDIYIGTMGWSAPEIDPNCNNNKYKYSSDIFSFGLLILYLLCGKHPLQISKQQHIKFYNEIKENDNEELKPSQIVRKIRVIWYNDVILKSEHMIKNFLIKLYYDNRISLHLFELLHDGMLVYDPKRRWNCKQIYHSKWFNQIPLRHHSNKSDNQCFSV